MNDRVRILICVMLTPALLFFVSAGVQGENIDRIIVSGDSWSDTGNVQRFTDGDVWHEYLADELGISRATPSSAGGANYATAGARTGPPHPNNIAAQVDAFLAADAVQNGDLFGILNGAVNFLGDQQTDTSAMVADVASRISTLAAAGAERFLVGTLPLVGETPRGMTMRDAFNTGSAAFNSELLEALPDLEQDFDIDIRVFDVHSLHVAVLGDPLAFGFTDTDQVGGSLYSDDVHFRTTFHALMAEQALTALTIPEPSSLSVVALLIVIATFQQMRRRFLTLTGAN